MIRLKRRLISAAKAVLRMKLKESRRPSVRRENDVGFDQKEKEYFVYSKGAPEVILENAVTLLKIIKKLSCPLHRKDILKQAEAMNMKALEH